MNYLNRRFSRLLTGFVVFVLAMGLSLGFSAIGHSADEARTEPPTTTEITTLAPEGEAEAGKGWVITSKSGKSEMALAAHLKKTGAKVYNGWYCSHCHEQNQLFGREAVQASFSTVAVECHEQGINPQVALCQKKDIKAVPTWEIRGKKYPGVQSPEKLAQLSGYKGPKQFLYSKLLQ